MWSLLTGTGKFLEWLAEVALGVIGAAVVHWVWLVLCGRRTEVEQVKQTKEAS